MDPYPDIRTELTVEQRVAELSITIDPGFVNERLIQTVLGAVAMPYIDMAIAALPELPPGLLQGRIDHIYTDHLLPWCTALDMHTLDSLLAQGSGLMFCSTVMLKPAADIYDSRRAASEVVLEGDHDLRVQLEYSTVNIHADTTRSNLAKGGVMAVVAQFHERREDLLVFHPLVMGAPWLTDGADAAPFVAPEWHSFEYFEIFVEDIDEFRRVREAAIPDDFSIMANVTESAFKQCLGEILGDSVVADWGGERSDHYGAHIHLRGKSKTGAFLLKGPGGGFRPMSLDHLGKRNDQIYRLAQEPAQILFVQHCHDVSPPVRATLRAFAVQPGSARRYCIIDGRDSLRILTAYDKLARAMELSAT